MKTSCPHCGQHYELEDSFAGQPVTCERCWKDFTVPAEKPSAAVPPPEPKPEPAKAPAAEKSKIPADGFSAGTVKSFQQRSQVTG